MKKLSVVVTLGMALLVGACGDDSNNNNNNNNNNSGTPTSHLTGAASGNGACDNPSEAPNNCYQYVGVTYAGTNGKASCGGTFSASAGCTSTGRGGRCTLYAGTENEYVVHCYQSASVCEQQCNGVGTFVAN